MLGSAIRVLFMPYIEFNFKNKILIYILIKIFMECLQCKKNIKRYSVGAGEMNQI